MRTAHDIVPSWPVSLELRSLKGADQALLSGRKVKSRGCWIRQCSGHGPVPPDPDLAFGSGCAHLTGESQSFMIHPGNFQCYLIMKFRNRRVRFKEVAIFKCNLIFLCNKLVSYPTLTNSDVGILQFKPSVKLGEYFVVCL